MAKTDGFSGATLAAILTAMILLCAGCCPTLVRQHADFRLRAGDLLFQDLDAGPLCDAIEEVTTGYHGANLSHVGIVAWDKSGELCVIEASSGGVRAVPVEAFLARSRDASGRPKVLAGRLIRQYRHLFPAALERAHALIGRPYDKAFDVENEAYYCSELVYACFLQSDSGAPLFALQPMTFASPGEGRTFPAWQAYFDRLHLPVPEGKPGINPGGISRSPALQIVHAYGDVSGLAATRSGIF